MMFKPGETHQFDWSHEDVEVAGKPMRVKIAHMRLCASRAVHVRAYPRELNICLSPAWWGSGRLRTGLSRAATPVIARR